MIEVNKWYTHRKGHIVLKLEEGCIGMHAYGQIERNKFHFHTPAHWRESTEEEIDLVRSKVASKLAYLNHERSKKQKEMDQINESINAMNLTQ